MIGALVEGCSIRSTERMFGVHRDTIMRLGVRVGEGCANILNETTRDLPCERLELDKLWARSSVTSAPTMTLHAWAINGPGLPSMQIRSSSRRS